MNDEIYKNNPLHGVGLKALLTEIVDHYGFSILYAYLNINCFKSNPSIESSVKFLKKTDWAREKVEAFYLYKFKNLPKASGDQMDLSPRERVVPQDHIPGEPADLSLEDGERLREERVKRAAEYDQSTGRRSGSGDKSGAQRGGAYSNHRENDRARKDDRESSESSSASGKSDSDPWAKWRK